MAFAKRLAKNHNTTSCDKCNQWVHMTCNITKYCYKSFKRTTAGSCIGKMMPFSNMTDMQLNRIIKERYVISQNNIDDLVSFILDCRKRPKYRDI